MVTIAPNMFKSLHVLFSNISFGFAGYELTQHQCWLQKTQYDKDLLFSLQCVEKQRQICLDTQLYESMNLKG